MAYSTQAGSFVGEPAYSAATNLLYVGDPSGSGSFNFGLVALREQPDCTWALAWQQNVGAYNTVDNNDPPSVANGVVYYNDGLRNESFAFNAAAGTALWNSGTTITGPIFAAPTIDGHLFHSILGPPPLHLRPLTIRHPDPPFVILSLSKDPPFVILSLSKDPPSSS